jgi:hypothetical protein
MALKRNEHVETKNIVLPLPTLDGPGFTQSVLARTRRLEWQRLGLNAVMWVSSVLAFLAVIPWHGFVAEVQLLLSSLLNQLYQLREVVASGEWLNHGVNQQFADNQAILLTILILTLFAGLTAGFLTEE